MTVIMKDAIKPNLVQTLEGQPVMIHAGPFGNIAHANNSIIQDRIALKLGDYVVTEGGFASDLGFQKFCDIVCRTGGFTPSAAVLVTTVRAMKFHGGVPFEQLNEANLDAVRLGSENLAAHIEIVKAYGLPCVVAINRFPSDTDEEIALVDELAAKVGAEQTVVNDGFSEGGDGRDRARRGRRRGGREAEQLRAAHPARHADPGAGGGDRDTYLRSGRRRLPPAGGQGHRADGGARLRDLPGLHGEDPPVAHA